MILCKEDKEVLKFDFEEPYIEILNNDLLPYTLKDYIKDTNPKDFKKSLSDITLLKDYFVGRTLNLSRTNAKIILNVTALPQSLKADERFKIVMACRGLCMQDNYWIKKDDERLSFKDVCLRKNKLSKNSYDIAILGHHISATAEELTSDLTTAGMFPKIWKRNGENVEFWKTDKFTNFPNTKAEILSSKILQNAGCNVVNYEEKKQGDIIFSVSKCMSDDDYSLVNMQEIRDWCTHTKRDIYEWIKENMQKDFANMCIADYVIANTDRHWENWGVLVDNDNVIYKFAPLFDLNQSLIADEFDTNIDDLIYEPTGIRFKDSIKMLVKDSTLDFSNQELPGKCKERWQNVLKYKEKQLENNIER